MDHRLKFSLLLAASLAAALFTSAQHNPDSTIEFVIPHTPSGEALNSPILLTLKTDGDFSDYDPAFQTRITAKLRLTVPTSRHMVQEAIQSLSGGWDGMTPAQQYYFRLLFDPGDTGELDEAFIVEVIANYRQMDAAFGQPITFVFETEDRLCIHQRVYYHLLGEVHVCPAFAASRWLRFVELSLVHELAHKTVFMFDRPYYQPDSAAYQALSPRGSWRSELPLIGPLFRELERTDTLYHPDAYAWYAAMVYKFNHLLADRTPSNQAELADKYLQSAAQGQLQWQNDIRQKI